MATAKELSLINTLISEGVTETGRPSFLKDWTPVRFLGKGNFGEVFEIRSGGERCALKIIAMDDDFIDQYAAEIDALNRIRDEKHAVRIEEYEILGVDRGAYIQRYMIIRMNLLSKLPKFMDEEDVVKLGLDMCDILATCHSCKPKILHCDIKPENILVSSDGSYMLSDFGAARISDKTHNSSGFRGTPLYMSPEMHNYEGYDQRSDLYSLGVTMYTLLNGGLQPFSNGTNSAQAVRMRLDGTPLPNIAGVSADIMKILRKLCEVDPDKRYQTAQELAADLAALTAPEESSDSEQTAKPDGAAYKDTVTPAKKPIASASEQPRRKPIWMIATAVTLVAAIISGAVFLPKLANGNKEVGSNDTVTVGDHVFFGNYPQTEDGEEQPIEWRVLDIEDGNVLMITEYLLDSKKYKYNETKGNVTWRTCTLREWLNNDFYNAAFSAEEQEKIVLRTNENPDNPETGVNGGYNTEDKVFCLSIDEAQKYFNNTVINSFGDEAFPDRIAKPTAYTIKNGAELDQDYGSDSWWLRSPGADLDHAAYVSSFGSIYTYGGPAYLLDTSELNPTRCVRPVILASLPSVSQQTKQNTQQANDLYHLFDLSGFSVGDHITFGSYSQTESGEAQPIEWRILDIREDGWDSYAFMISEYILDCKKYNEINDDVTWETCTLRKWLNNYFYNTAFSDEEKRRILLNPNENPDNQNYRIWGGNNTDDKVFCLSIDEAQKYFDDNRKETGSNTTYPDRMVEPTEYAKKNGAWTSFSWGTGRWWLRSPGNKFSNAAIVNIDGSINDNSIYVNCDEFGVRPVIFISLFDELEYQTADNIQQATELPALADLSKVTVGDHVAFGSYPQTESGEVQPIEWRVLDIENGKALMISEYILDYKVYNEILEDTTWEYCTLRKWLNTDFYNTSFSAEEQNRIEIRTNINPNNPEYGTAGGNNTDDRVFLLNIDDVRKYFDETVRKDKHSYFPDGIAKPTVYATRYGAQLSTDGADDWWLRSPGYTSFMAVYIFYDGEISFYGTKIDDSYIISSKAGIRPAILVSLSD